MPDMDPMQTYIYQQQMLQQWGAMSGQDPNQAYNQYGGYQQQYQPQFAMP